MQRLPTFSLARSELHSRLSLHQEGGVCSSRCRRTGYQTQVAPGTARNKDSTLRGARGRPRSPGYNTGRGPGAECPHPGESGAGGSRSWARGSVLHGLPLAARASRAGSLPPEECGERLVSGAHGEDFMTADGAVASPGDPRQRCEPPAALAAALVSTPAQNK